MLNFIRALCAMFFFGVLTACGGGVSILPEPFTRERADGKIPVKTELIRAQVRAELAGMPEGEAEVVRWQQIEADYHSCRLQSGKATTAQEQVFADCMANRGYVYMYRIDAEQLHNDIAFEMEKAPEKWSSWIATATVAVSPMPITITNQGATTTIITALPTLTNAASTTITNTLSDGGFDAKYLLLGAAVIGGGVALASKGGGNDSPAAPNMPPPFWMTTATPLDVTSPELGAWHGIDRDGSFLFYVVWVPTQGTNFVTIGRNFNVGRANVNIHRQRVTRREPVVEGGDWLQVDRACLYSGGEDCLFYQQDGNALVLPPGTGQLFFHGRPEITLFQQLCPARWLGDYINANFVGTTCVYPSGISYSPDMHRVVYVAMADGFNRGFAIGEGGFAFSGRYDGDNRAAGFVYDFADYGFAMRTDYVRLPSKQDSAVWLDTYRFGVMPVINDDMRLFAGVDNYNNAILVIDKQGDGIAHRFGAAMGEGNNGYAIKYELHLNL